jgi:hypothetical protein
LRGGPLPRKLAKVSEFARQELPPASPPSEVQYLSRIAASLDRLVALVEDRLRAPEVEAPKPRGRDATRARTKAQEFIEDLLRYQGPQPWTEIVRRGRGYGNSEKTLERVRHTVAYVKKVDGRWLWHLKDNAGME